MQRNANASDMIWAQFSSFQLDAECLDDDFRSATIIHIIAELHISFSLGR
jgi:hypothetical protein